MLRLLALSWPGTEDMEIWKSWAHSASTIPVSDLYGEGSENGKPVWRVLHYGTYDARIDYPPLMVYGLGAVGRIYSLTTVGNFARRAFNGYIRAPIVLGDLVSVGLILLALRGRTSPARLNAAIIAFWLNPAILLATTLGYLDAVAFPAAIAALMCATGNLPLASGLLLAISMLLKPQAILFSPVLLALWLRRGGVVAALRGIGGAGAVFAACLVPFAVAGTVPNLIAALQTLGRHDMISGNACNLWWLVGYAIHIADAIRSGASIGVAIAAPVDIISVTRFVSFGFPNPRYIGVGLVAAATVVAVRAVWRRPDREQGAAAAALLVCSYFVLAAQVHENHFWPAVPLLIVAAAINPRYRWPTVTLSVLFALNLAVFYGLGRTRPAIVPRQLGIDLTVVIAIAIVLGWSWLVALVWRERGSSRLLLGFPPGADASSPPDQREASKSLRQMCPDAADSA